MKFILFVEGHTEDLCIARFLKRWLDNQLQQSIGITTIRFNGSSHFCSECNKKATYFLNAPDIDTIVAVVGLVDLYGLDAPFPKNIKSTEARYGWGKQYFEGAVNHPKFRMFFAVHEIEAWLFSEPDVLPEKVAAAVRKIKRPPEAIDFDKPPKQRLKRLYRDNKLGEYKQRAYGEKLFGLLKPQTAYAKCPYLKAMLDELKALAIAAGCAAKS